MEADALESILDGGPGALRAAGRAGGRGLPAARADRTPPAPPDALAGFDDDEDSPGRPAEAKPAARCAEAGGRGAAQADRGPNGAARGPGLTPTRFHCRRRAAGGVGGDGGDGGGGARAPEQRAPLALSAGDAAGPRPGSGGGSGDGGGGDGAPAAAPAAAAPPRKPAFDPLGRAGGRGPRRGPSSGGGGGGSGAPPGCGGAGERRRPLRPDAAGLEDDLLKLVAEWSEGGAGAGAGGGSVFLVGRVARGV
jgi:hypothetical protein